MEKFFTNVAVNAFLQLIENEKFNAWLDKKRADITEDIKRELDSLEQAMFHNIEALPSIIIGDVDHTVKDLLGGVPSQVAIEVEPMIGNMISAVQRGIQDALNNLNPFKGFGQ
jgi:predicted RNA-binding protein with EMAP domain